MTQYTYINGVGNISPQKTFDNSLFLEELVSKEGNQLKCEEPNYRDFVPADMARRMSRIIKMGVASAKTALLDAGCVLPDAIITGTGLGCIEDTEKFLGTMIRNKEELLTPTSFIQSTHNTVSAQIALLLKCHNYNITYVHRALSFESALLDALLRIGSDQVKTVLLGGSDELTQNSFVIQQRLGHWKSKPINNLSLIDDPTRGTLAGEGSAFFLLSNEKNNKSYSRVIDIDTFIYPESIAESEHKIADFLSRNSISAEDVDLVIMGKSGDPAFDAIYTDICQRLFMSSGLAFYKHLCGEYFTSTAFAFWLAAKILKHHMIPPVTLLKTPGRNPNTILIYNHYRNINHSLILLTRP